MPLSKPGAQAKRRVFLAGVAVKQTRLSVDRFRISCGQLQQGSKRLRVMEIGSVRRVRQRPVRQAISGLNDAGISHSMSACAQRREWQLHLEQQIIGRSCQRDARRLVPTPNVRAKTDSRSVETIRGPVTSGRKVEFKVRTDGAGLADGGVIQRNKDFSASGTPQLIATLRIYSARKPAWKPDWRRHPTSPAIQKLEVLIVDPSFNENPTRSRTRPRIKSDQLDHALRPATIGICQTP